MKKIIAICTVILLTANMFAQSPNKMSYQAVIRNASNALVSNQVIGMRVSILQSSPSGTAVYVETQSPTTNVNGLVSIEIGGGTIVSGSFANIYWANGPYFVKTETDPTGGNNFSITGTSQLLSVPYSLLSESTNDTTTWKKNFNELYSMKNIGIGIIDPNVPLHVDGNILADNGSVISKSTSGNNYPHFQLNFNSTLWEMALSNPNQLYIGNQTSGKLFVNSNGNVGIGTNSPARTLHVNSVMRLEPIAIAPIGPAKGDMYFDSTLNKLRVYDGSSWQNCW
jgi:hypothetical protein